MPSPPEIIAYHGWGFNAACWRDWQAEMTRQGYHWQSFDRGYFGSSYQPHFTAAARKILFVHSYGLHLCPIEQLQQADALVIFSSFQEFHPASRLRSRSQQVVQRMIEQLQVDPRSVLTRFYQNCYLPDVGTETCPAWIAPDQIEPDQIEIDRLLSDLQQLNQVKFDLSLLQNIPTIVKFHGLSDRIVAIDRLSLTELPFNLQNAPINHTIDNAGHMLLFTHRSACWSKLQPILSSIA